MGSPSGNASYRVTGRLAYGCTDLTAAWPHGGSGLGICGQVYFSPPSTYAVAEREEDGSVGRVVYTGGRAALGADLLQRDDDAISVCFPSTSSTAEGELIEWPGAGVLPGEDVASLGVLVFTPINQEEHPTFVLYNAYPVLETNQQMWLSSYRVNAVRLLFLGAEDTNGRVAASGPIDQIPGVA